MQRTNNNFSRGNSSSFIEIPQRLLNSIPVNDFNQSRQSRPVIHNQEVIPLYSKANRNPYYPNEYNPHYSSSNHNHYNPHNSSSSSSSSQSYYPPLVWSRLTFGPSENFFGSWAQNSTSSIF
eukprot:TRINITY_DN2808_c1_g1_i2.p1 TRINITY_DN2808_c1_g1~~TRINITY_DN2808_c1_g1_i2.p1  ORF type:complete len:122 (-),score=19.29 TRINITY_DN2808_c1_g1_i2:82-447(-)